MAIQLIDVWRCLMVSYDEKTFFELLDGYIAEERINFLKGKMNQKTWNELTFEPMMYALKKIAKGCIINSKNFNGDNVDMYSILKKTEKTNEYCRIITGEKIDFQSLDTRRVIWLEMFKTITNRIFCWIDETCEGHEEFDDAFENGDISEIEDIFGGNQTIRFFQEGKFLFVNIVMERYLKGKDDPFKKLYKEINDKDNKDAISTLKPNILKVWRKFLNDADEGIA